MKKIEKNKQLQVKCKIRGLKKLRKIGNNCKSLLKRESLWKIKTTVRRSKGFLVFIMEGNRGIPVLGLSTTEMAQTVKLKLAEKIQKKLVQ